MMAAVEPSSANSGAAMRSKGQRFQTERGTTDQGVGPGSYEAHTDGSLAASVAKSVERMSRSNPGFGSRQPARELPYQKEQADMPGPGAYDSKGKDARVDGHSSAFKSGSQRLQVEEETGDPGAYDPTANRDLAHLANSSFGRSNRAGSGAFGASSARDMKLDIMGEDTPGPGSYRSKQDLAEKQHMPSSAFRSSSSQRAKTRLHDTPGAGSYDPNMAAVEPGSANSGAGMRSKASRFTAERTTTDQGVGPGSYENHADGSLAASVAKSVERMSRSNPGFGSRQPARELPYQKEQADMPGPGAYEQKGKDNPVDGHGSAFKSGTQRLQVEEVTGDPGAYDPNSNRDLAHQANSSFGRSNR